MSEVDSMLDLVYKKAASAARHAGVHPNDVDDVIQNSLVYVREKWKVEVPVKWECSLAAVVRYKKLEATRGWARLHKLAKWVIELAPGNVDFISSSGDAEIEPDLGEALAQYLSRLDPLERLLTEWALKLTTRRDVRKVIRKKNDTLVKMRKECLMKVVGHLQASTNCADGDLAKFAEFCEPQVSHAPKAVDTIWD